MTVDDTANVGCEPTWLLRPSAWAFARSIHFDFTAAGRPVRDAFIETFNGRLRDECLLTGEDDLLAQCPRNPSRFGRQPPVHQGCGDGFRDEDEECDDGNGVPDDGYNLLCQFQASEQEPNDVLQASNAYVESACHGEVSSLGARDFVSVDVSTEVNPVVETQDL